jgi:hypothetical protein
MKQKREFFCFNEAKVGFSGKTGHRSRSNGSNWFDPMVGDPEAGGFAASEGSSALSFF